MRMIILPATLLTLGLGACGSPDTVDNTADGMSAEAPLPTETPSTATAQLANADGAAAGSVTVTADASGALLLLLNVENVEPGEHGVHVHMTGLCEGPDFSSAGGHWNPTDAAHGLESPDGQHAGDMPNLEVGEDGTGTLEYTLGGGATFEGLLDEDGSAFIIHAGPDDQVTDPSGDSGDRIACGVFEPGDAGLTPAA